MWSRSLAPFTLRVQFADGTVGGVRFEPSRLARVLYSTHVRGQLIFQQARAEDGFVTWPGDLDLAPDAIYDATKPLRVGFSVGGSIAVRR